MFPSFRMLVDLSVKAIYDKKTQWRMEQFSSRCIDLIILQSILEVRCLLVGDEYTIALL